MAEQRPSPSSSDGTYEVESLFDSKGTLDVTTERIQDCDGTKVAELRIFGLDGEDRQSFELYKSSSGEVKMCGPPIVRPTGVVGIRYACTTEGVEGLHIIHRSLPGCGGDTPDTGPGKGGKMLDAELHILASSWQSMPIEHAISTWTQMDRWKTLYDRFEEAGDLNDISEAISILREVVERTPERDVNLPAMLNNLGSSFLCRFEHTGNLSDLAEAISSHKQALDLTPEGHDDLPSNLNNLGNSLICRFERTGNLGDIVESISLQTRAVDLTPEGHADLPTMLTNLGGLYVSQFEQTGNLGDVAESISLQTRAVGLTPEGHADLPSRLMNLGTSYMRRFHQTNNLLDINEAIIVQSRAVTLLPAGNASQPGYLTNLGNSFMGRFHLSLDPSDLFEAISSHAQSVDLTPDSHPDLPARLNNLGNSLVSRFEHSGNLDDVTGAIALQTRAVSLTPREHANLPDSYASLGNTYARRFSRTGDPNDVTEAIYNLGQAVRLTPEMHPSLPSMRYRLAFAWCQYYLSSGHRGHLYATISNCKSAALCSSGRPEARLLGATQWARGLVIYNKKSLSVESITAFETAMHLLMLVAGLEETVQHRYTTLERHGGLPLEAAAVAIMFGALQKALEWLEQGRCLVWGQHSRLRTPLDELKIHDEPLANRVMEVSRLLEGLASSRRHSSTDESFARKITLEDEALKHSQLASEWDRLLEHVRAIHGFENFLRPLRCAALLPHLPRLGPVVVLNVHEYRCDAIILRAGSDGLQHIRLPDFTLGKAKHYRRMLGVQLQCHGLRDQDVDITGRAGRLYGNKARDGFTVHCILKSLWEEVVKPILNVLEFSKGDSDTSHLLPRIWWCPTGPLSFLPLHAAGVYRGEGAESISDYAVSSYTPTVTALTQRVKNGFPIDERASGLFLTCQPEAPYAGSIHETKAEVGEIHGEATALGVRSLSLEGGAVTPEKCLQYMEEYSSIHLACHGFQDPSDPLRSRFLFHKGPLPLSAIMQKNLPNADLAYLSACQTSAGQETLANEVVHLAAGMLAAGYRRVVSTMWVIGDGHASQVANDFYQYLWRHRPEGSGSRFDGSLSAYALHYATQELRGRLDNTDRSLLAWMPFVHYGY